MNNNNLFLDILIVCYNKHFIPSVLGDLGLSLSLQMYGVHEQVGHKLTLNNSTNTDLMLVQFLSFLDISCVLHDIVM